MITARGAAIPRQWRDALPVLNGTMVRLREVEVSDASTLLDLVSAPEVARFIHEPPDTLESYEQFIGSAQDERKRGRFMCWGVVPHGMQTAVGLFHLRRLDSGFDTAELGFVLGSAFWGTGIFPESAELVLDFAFDVVGVTRVEARVALPNGRGNGALQKMGAVQEAILRNGFTYNGRAVDQVLWAIVDTDRLGRKSVSRQRMYVH